MREFNLEKMRAACRMAAETLRSTHDIIKPGITTDDINRFVHNFTIQRGGYPAPLNYRGFPKSVCTSVNDVVCHGIPGKLTLKEGDIVNVDVTTILDGHFGDTNATFLVGQVNEDVMRLVACASSALLAGIKQVKPGVSLNAIGTEIQRIAHINGYTTVREFGGHGIGTRFHTLPQVSHYDTGDDSIILKSGMIFTIEPMINMGTADVWLESDRWTVRTVDGMPSVQYEHTCLVTDDGVEILTK